MGEGELNEIALRLHAASIALSHMFHRDEAGGLSARRQSALATLAFAGPISLAALAEAEQVRPPTMSRIVEALVEAELASREAVPGDRRARLLASRLKKLADSELRALARGVDILVRAIR